MELEKILPPKMTLSCNEDYRMIKLVKSNMNEGGKLPEGTIFTNGVVVYPWECQGLHSISASTMSPWTVTAPVDCSSMIGPSVNAKGLPGSGSNTTEAYVRSDSNLEAILNLEAIVKSASPMETIAISASPMETIVRSASPMETIFSSVHAKGAVSDSSAAKTNVRSPITSVDSEPTTYFSCDVDVKSLNRSSDSRLETNATNAGANNVGALNILPAVSPQPVKVPEVSAQVANYVIDSESSMDSMDIAIGNFQLTGKSSLQDLAKSRTQLKYQCPYCAKTLTRKQTFLDHTTRFHPGLPIPGILLPKIVNKTMGSIKGLRVPIVNKTSKEVKSSFNPAPYQSLTLLSKTHASKPFKTAIKPYPNILKRFTILPSNTVVVSGMNTSSFGTACYTSSAASLVATSELSSLQKPNP